MSRLITLLFGVGIGAAAAHFLDPQSGRSRRQKIRGQAVSKLHVPSAIRGEELDDKTLAHKVETEIFRAPDAPKGDVSVDVQAGVVNLRGEVADDQWITRLGDEAGHVDGIKGVNNLLHPPGTPAPAAEPRGTVTDR
jgi:osmotically-inducible protein OsmY